MQWFVQSKFKLTFLVGVGMGRGGSGRAGGPCRSVLTVEIILITQQTELREVVEAM